MSNGNRPLITTGIGEGHKCKIGYLGQLELTGGSNAVLKQGHKKPLYFVDIKDILWYVDIKALPLLFRHSWLYPIPQKDLDKKKRVDINI